LRVPEQAKPIPELRHLGESPGGAFSKMRSAPAGRAKAPGKETHGGALPWNLIPCLTYHSEKLYPASLFHERSMQYWWRQLCKNFIAEAFTRFSGQSCPKLRLTCWC